jgi:hypothetical protein
MAALGCSLTQRSLPLWRNEALLHRASAVAIEPDSSAVRYQPNRGGWPKPAPTSTSKLKIKNGASRHHVATGVHPPHCRVEATLLIVLAIALWWRWRN